MSHGLKLSEISANASVAWNMNRYIIIQIVTELELPLAEAV